MYSVCYTSYSLGITSSKPSFFYTDFVLDHVILKTRTAMWHLYTFLVLLIDLVTVVVNLYNFAVFYILLSTTTYSLIRSSEFHFLLSLFLRRTNDWIYVYLKKTTNQPTNIIINGKKTPTKQQPSHVFFLTGTFMNKHVTVPLYFRMYSRGPSSFESRLKRWNTCITIQQVLPKGWYTEIILTRLCPTKQTDLMESNRQTAMCFLSFSV